MRLKIMAKFLVLFLSLFIFTSCIKTAEQVQRERRFESMSEQMSDSQGLIADVVSQMKDIQSQLDRLNGRLEELEHKNKQLDPRAVKTLSENVDLLKAQQETQSIQMNQIQAELKDQRVFLEKVTGTLSKMNSAPAHASKKKNAKEELAAALELVKSNAYAEARNELEALIGHKDLTPGDNNKVMHGLGRVEFFTKNYDKALVYFSKIYTKFPNSSLAPSSLSFIAKSLAKTGKKDEAREAFAKLIEDYPTSKEAAEAKKEL
jgi:TolA-binding protein